MGWCGTLLGEERQTKMLKTHPISQSQCHVTFAHKMWGLRGVCLDGAVVVVVFPIVVVCFALQICDIHFSHNASLAISCSDDNTAVVWNTATMHKATTLHKHTSYVSEVWWRGGTQPKHTLMSLCVCVVTYFCFYFVKCVFTFLFRVVCVLWL